MSGTLARGSCTWRHALRTWNSNLRGAPHRLQAGMSSGAGRPLGLGHRGRAPSLKQYRMTWLGAHAMRAWNICGVRAVAAHGGGRPVVVRPRLGQPKAGQAPCTAPTPCQAPASMGCQRARPASGPASARQTHRKVPALVRAAGLHLVQQLRGRVLLRQLALRLHARLVLPQQPAAAQSPRTAVQTVFPPARGPGAVARTGASPQQSRATEPAHQCVRRSAPLAPAAPPRSLPPPCQRLPRHALQLPPSRRPRPPALAHLAMSCSSCSDSRSSGSTASSSSGYRCSPGARPACSRAGSGRVCVCACACVSCVRAHVRMRACVVLRVRVQVVCGSRGGRSCLRHPTGSVFLLVPCVCCKHPPCARLCLRWPPGSRCACLPLPPCPPRPLPSLGSRAPRPRARATGPRPTSAPRPQPARSRGKQQGNEAGTWASAQRAPGSAHGARAARQWQWPWPHGQASPGHGAHARAAPWAPCPLALAARSCRTGSCAAAGSAGRGWHLAWPGRSPGAAAAPPSPEHGARG